MSDSRRYYIDPVTDDVVRVDFDDEGNAEDIAEYMMIPEADCGELPQPQNRDEECAQVLQNGMGTPYTDKAELHEATGQPLPKDFGQIKSVEVKDDEDDLDEDEPEEDAGPKQAPPKRHEQVRKDVLAGMSPGALASKYNMTVGSVYQLRSEMRKEGLTVPKPRRLPKPTKEQEQEIRQRRANGETTTEISKAMELDYADVEHVKADMRVHGVGDKKPQKKVDLNIEVKKLVDKGCSIGDINIAFPKHTDRAIEVAYAWAKRDSAVPTS